MIVVRDDTGSRGSGTPEKFSVDLESLTTLAGALEELETDAENARTYSTTYADVDPSGGSLMARLGDATIHVDDDLERLFRRLSQIAGRAATEIRKSRDTYSTLDAQAAQELDTTYWSR